MFSSIRIFFTGILLSLVLSKAAPADNRVSDVTEASDGWVVIGHEVRTFTPCGRTEVLWLYGSSERMGGLRSEYASATAGMLPYTPVWMRLNGRYTGSPNNGFAADLPGAFLVDGLLVPNGAHHCRWEVIRVTYPRPGGLISSPLRLFGEVRGNWFFEGDFPVTIETVDGLVVVRGFVSARGDWMTPEFVPFEGALTFEPPKGVTHGMLVFRKDNPSDDRSLDEAMRLPIRFR